MGKASVWVKVLVRRGKVAGYESGESRGKVTSKVPRAGLVK